MRILIPKTGVTPYIFLILLTAFSAPSGFSQAKKTASAPAARLSRPKLVVGIVVDQMRWDYLYRYYDRYSETGGFKRLLNTGFSCENTMINYLPSETGVGHTTIFTGSVPAIHGIVGNDWNDRFTGKPMYCTQDDNVQSVGTTSNAGKMSPRNLLATTVTDELRLATNYRSKVVGVSLKDRASILPAGHHPTAAFWMDDLTGNFITSTYYMSQLPDWVTAFNNEKNIEKLVAGGWNTLYPISTYTQSSADDVSWEGRLSGETKPVFPHDLAAIYRRSHSSFRSTPFGNTLTLNFAKAAISAYNLGGGTETDFLTINCASTDYVGHLFGPNSIEEEDTFLRLDKDLGDLFATLDKKLGKDSYLVFLSADHGASHSLGFNKENKIPSGGLNSGVLLRATNQYLKAKFGADSLARSIASYVLDFNYDKVNRAKLDFSAVKKEAAGFLRTQPGIYAAVDNDEIASSTLPKALKEMAANSYYYKRSGDIQLFNEPGWFSGGATGTSHGTWSPYDVHIPLVFMGWGIKHGATNRAVTMSDIAPTVAALLHIQMGNGTIGTPITEVINAK
jgi:hypothetical protein